MQFEVTTRSGIVRDVQVFSETHLTGGSSGGGGYLHQGSGHVASPQVRVSSEVVTTQRIFLEDNDGEWTCSVGKDFAVRPGHHIKVWFLATRRGGMQVIRVLNAVTGKNWRGDIARGHLPRSWLMKTSWAGVVAVGFFLLLNWERMRRLRSALFRTPMDQHDYELLFNVQLAFWVLLVVSTVLLVAFIWRYRSTVRTIWETVDKS